MFVSEDKESIQADLKKPIRQDLSVREQFDVVVLHRPRTQPQSTVTIVISIIGLTPFCGCGKFKY